MTPELGRNLHSWQEQMERHRATMEKLRKYCKKPHKADFHPYRIDLWQQGAQE